MKSRWKKIFIASTFCFTIYNTLPSAFYYSKPLEDPIKFKETHKIVKDWRSDFARHNQELMSWVRSFTEGLGIKNFKVSDCEGSQRTLSVEFASQKDLELFEGYFSKAIRHVPYKTFEMTIASKENTTLFLSKKYPTTALGLNESLYINALQEQNANQNLKILTQARAQNVLDALFSYDMFEKLLLAKQERLQKIKSQDVLEILNFFGSNPELQKRLITESMKSKKTWIHEVISELKSSEDGLSASQKNLLSMLTLAQKPKARSTWLEDSASIEHPLIKSLVINHQDGFMELKFHDDVIASMQNAQIKLLVSETLAQIKHKTHDLFMFEESRCQAKLIKDKKSPLLITKLDTLAKEHVQDLQKTLKRVFNPDSEILKGSNFPIVDSKEFEKLSPVDQESCLIVFAPLADNTFVKNCNKQSMYIVCKNLDRLLKEQDKQDPLNAISKDIKALTRMLNAYGFTQVSSSELGLDFKNDLIFELQNAFNNVFAILEDSHKFFGDLPYVVCELGSYKDRLSISYHNQVKKQESLVTWSENYAASTNQLKGFEPKTIAKPTQSPLFSKLLFKIKTFFTGSEKAALKFGLDLSGGKNILIQLEDQQGRKVTDQDNIKTAISELYQRVNKLGVSEVSIRQEGDFISLDFPGSQNLSASELVNASHMYFHVVNEEFSFQNKELFPFVTDFLNQVWQQAIQEGTTDNRSLNKIAFDILNSTNTSFVSAKKLLEKGLKLADPHKNFSSDHLDKTYSKIVKVKTQEDQIVSAPLMIVFNNYALEGTALKNINCSYDPTKGNFLSFGVEKELSGKQIAYSPQEKLSEWTTQFTKLKSQQNFMAQRGWRMAVVLDSEVVSAPVLESALKDSASITGSFTQRDLIKLKSDLQAGSLSFQPKIILEQNIAPELGSKDKTSGLLSMTISLILVTGLMTAYYRFHGIVATSALLLNLLMLFAAANFFGITLSLASIAGIVLTLGMAVDANVLIFERMREEKSKGSSLQDSVIKGYSKAFTAIIDSNLTTMIAAGVLMGFDSGPIKGFALTLLIGLVTSVITALFMTKFFYFNWIEKTQSMSLKFSNWFNFQNIDFLKKTKIAAASTVLIFAIGAACLGIKASDVVGMDFKGGYAVDLKLHSKNIEKIKTDLVQAFTEKGLKSSHIQVRELDDPTHVRIFIDPQVNKIKPQDRSWSQFLNTLLGPKGLKIEKNCLKSLDHSVTSVSGQLSEAMRNQAIIGLVIALGAIFVYVVFRFKWTYSIAATISLVHDVVLTLACIGILALFNVPVSLDMSSLAALLTIIGYSLNDTIIVFDRVREEITLNPNQSMKEIVTKSLNATLSRTILTSGTTLIVLIPMIFIGHGTLFNFSLVMTLGVVLGTLSTLYIACPLLLYFSKKQANNLIQN